MTSDTNRPLEARAFIPAEPEPAPSFEPEPASHALPDAAPPTATVQAGRPGSSRRTRLVVNGVPDTDYHRQADASASDVSTGTTVTVGLDGLRLRDGAGATAGDVTIVP